MPCTQGFATPHAPDAARPSAAAALKAPYFEALTEAEQPVVTPPPDPEQIKAAFRFEEENLAANELRILLANDLFRSKAEEEASSPPSAQRPPSSLSRISCSAPAPRPRTSGASHVGRARSS